MLDGAPLIFGGIEAGGTKWVCAIGTGPDDILESAVFPTGSPEETIGRAAAFLTRNKSLAAVGVGSFGPIDLERTSPTWGRITTTPKAGWRNTDLGSALEAALEVPIAIDTDVNAAALGEHRWGAAIGLDTFCYITVGTGIGGGGMVNGRVMHGLLHPEFGHMRIPHDRQRDPFEGICPYHGDCLEGLASGEAARRRWPDAHAGMWDTRMVALEAEYLALGLMNVIATLSPQRVILGGGVMKEPALLRQIRTRVRELCAGYFEARQLNDKLHEYIVAPILGDCAAVLGALELARRRRAAATANYNPTVLAYERLTAGSSE
jgi:fructokinase